MDKMQRIGISIEDDLLKNFDKLIEIQGYANRSESVRDMIRDKLMVADLAKPNTNAIAAIFVVYDHHSNDLSQALNNIQHNNLNIIRSSTHVHIDHQNCLEVIIMKGKSSEIKKLTDLLSSTKGIKHGKLIMTSTGSDLS